MDDINNYLSATLNKYENPNRKKYIYIIGNCKLKYK